jgi:hypothetical protein
MMGVVAMKDDKFECAACGLEFGRETAVSDCRVCHRSLCDQCLDKNGLCVPCSEEPK